MRRSVFAVFVLPAGVIAATVLAMSSAAAAECRSLSGQRFGNAQIIETNEVTPPFSATSMGPPEVKVTVAFCRVRGVLRPVPGSNITFELWLPPAGRWNGDYQANAPGGFAGSMLYAPSARGLEAGYAVSTTDNGHTGSDTRDWAIGHPERVADWGWRAVHETAVASKAIIAAYYASAPKYSYFVGCSKGGASGLTEAQRFPTEFNGIIAAAPGWDHSGQLTKYLWAIQTVQAPGGWISPAKLATLNKAVLSACNVRGAYMEDPSSCRFDPGRLQCKGADADTCLTAQEVTSVRRLYSGPVDASGKSIFPGYAVGSEMNWSRALMGSKENPGVGTSSYDSFTSMVRDLLFENADWNLQALQPIDIYKQSQSKLGPDWDAVDPDLGTFKANGGKMITYQGWSDNNVPPLGSIKYYELVAAKMGGAQQAEAFYRLFMAPGMEHCGMGPGPNAVGGPYGLPPPVNDPEHDVAAALAQWVEKGIAPEKLVATHYTDNDPAKGTDAQLPWCVYPATARYVGKGDRSQAGNWVCRRGK